MKLIKILQAVTLVAIVCFATGCVSGRHYSSYPPPPPAYGSSFSLIINPYPGLAISRYSDGRYYYRSPQGYTYWRGYDNRYYLDRSYVGKQYRSHRDYNDWRNNGRNYNGRHHRH
ncbi:MAG: hypothetical protein ABUT20_09705 [Bacteroidota bacterium]